MAMDVKQVVDIEQGLIGRRIFIEREIYAQELERIFARCWLFLCHEPAPPPRGLLHDLYGRRSGAGGAG